MILNAIHSGSLDNPVDGFLCHHHLRNLFLISLEKETFKKIFLNERVRREEGSLIQKQGAEKNVWVLRPHLALVCVPSPHSGSPWTLVSALSLHPFLLEMTSPDSYEFRTFFANYLCPVRR